MPARSFVAFHFSSTLLPRFCFQFCLVFSFAATIYLSSFRYFALGCQEHPHYTEKQRGRQLIILTECHREMARTEYAELIQEENKKMPTRQTYFQLRET